MQAGIDINKKIDVRARFSLPLFAKVLRLCNGAFFRPWDGEYPAQPHAGCRSKVGVGFEKALLGLR